MRARRVPQADAALVVRRIETGVGYFLNERTLLRATVQWNELYGFDDDDLEGALPAIQLEAAF